MSEPQETMKLNAPLTLSFFALLIAARSADAESFNYDVPDLVVPLKQEGDTCWATTATMLASARQKVSLRVEDVTAKAGPDFAKLYKARIGLPKARKADLITGLNFVAVAPACYSPEAFRELLKKHGALWVTVDTADAAMTHAVVVTGVAGDGTAARTTVKFNDPADGKARVLPFARFMTKYESAAGKSEIQIVYAR